MIASKAIPPLVRSLTWLDLLVCAALATPPTARMLFGLLQFVSNTAGGQPVQAPIGPDMFFVNLAGLFGVLWNIAMLTETGPRLHKVDLVARIGVIALIVFHIGQSGLALVFGLFVITELVGGAAKIAWLSRGEQ